MYRKKDREELNNLPPTPRDGKRKHQCDFLCHQTYSIRCNFKHDVTTYTRSN